jgi:hypothetical protein
MELVTKNSKLFIGKVRLPEFYTKTQKRSIIQIDKNDGIYAIQEQEGLSQRRYCH